MAKTSFSVPKPAKLLKWYDLYGRALPWRSHEGRAPSPYHTWLSEIMLQQTTVATVIPYYERFTSRWPNVRDLAAAHEDDVLKEWAGLGYYSRARNLLACARRIVTEHDGRFPSDITALKALPGIGDYTANAIRAIAFNLPAVVVDGNVERVMARIFAFDQPANLPANKKILREYAATVAPTRTASRHGDYAQALMDLGSKVCSPRNPACDVCPWQSDCTAYTLGKPDAFPVIQRRAKTPERFCNVFVLRNPDGHLFMRQRPAEGLLGGLWEFPSTTWIDAPAAPTSKDTPVTGAFTQLAKPVIHVFSHFKLTSTVFIRDVPARAKPKTQGQWISPDDLPALSTLTQKIRLKAFPLES